MSRQVVTPRFYVDIPSFLHATGQLGWDDSPRGGSELLYMNPSNPFTRIDENSTIFSIGKHDTNTPKTSFPINFCALLNHNFASDNNNVQIVGKYGTENERLHGPTNGVSNVLNTSSSDDDLGEEYNGTSICTFTSMDRYWTSFEVFISDGIDTSVNHQLGSLVVGKYWDAPNNPDLNLTMTRRFEGIKKQRTIGGKTLSNIYYDGATEWTMNRTETDIYTYPPFELDSPDDIADDASLNKRAKSGLGRKGLRTWEFTFSYISESDMWMDNEVSNTLTSDDVTPNDDIPNPMISNDSFNFVWNCTLGGTLPFIFQPDNTNRNPDNFSICTFRDNSLSVNQVAHNTYSLSVTIDEVA